MDGEEVGVVVSDSPWSEQVFPHSSQRCNEYITQSGVKRWQGRRWVDGWTGGGGWMGRRWGGGS